MMMHAFLSTDVAPESWNASYAALSVARYVEGRRDKLTDLLARHRELEQSENKAQGALLSILTLTQITELKLLLDIGQHSHNFFFTVLTLLLVCICLEVLAGIIILYIGNIHSNQGRGDRKYRYGRGSSRCGVCPLSSCCRPAVRGGGGYYRTVNASATDPLVPQGASAVNWTETAGDQSTVCCCCVRSSDVDMRQKLMMTGGRGGGATVGGPGMMGVGPAMDESSSTRTTGELEMRMFSGSGGMGGGGVGGHYASMMSPVGSERMELCRGAVGGAGGGGCVDTNADRMRGGAQGGGGGAGGGPDRGVLGPSLTETSQQRALDVIDQMNSTEDKSVFIRMSFWKNITMYIIYFVILMNIFIVTFGISGR